MTRARAWVIGLAFAAGSTFFACGDDEAECSKTDDCSEVVCPDGTKIRKCASGKCLELGDCGTGTGGW